MLLFQYKYYVIYIIILLQCLFIYYMYTKIIEVQDSEIGKGRRHCWTQCKFMGPFFDIAAFRSTFGARIFHERYIYLQYKDTE